MSGNHLLGGFGTNVIGFSILELDAGANPDLTGNTCDFHNDTLVGFTTADPLNRSGFTDSGLVVTLGADGVLAVSSTRNGINNLTISGAHAGSVFGLNSDFNSDAALTEFVGLLLPGNINSNANLRSCFRRSTNW